MRVLAVRLPDRLDEALRDLALSEKTTVSGIIRSAIVARLDEEGVAIPAGPSIEETLEALDRSYEERGWVDSRSG